MAGIVSEHKTVCRRCGKRVYPRGGLIYYNCSVCRKAIKKERDRGYTTTIDPFK